METDTKRMKSDLGHNCRNMLITSTEKLTEDKDKEIRTLTYTLDKHRANIGKDKNQQEQLQHELDSQREAWRQLPEEPQLAEQRALEARRDTSGTMQCFICSRGNLQQAEKLTDKQVQHIIRQVINGQQFALVAGNHMRVLDALEDVGPSQRQKALEHINAHLRTPQNCLDGQQADDLTEFF